MNQKPKFVSAEQLPKQLRDHLARAMQFHQTGRIGAAEDLYRMILTEMPDCIDALHFSGLAAAHRGAVDDGIARLRRAVELYPAAVIHCNLARLCMQKGDFLPAIACCDKAIEAEPANGDAWFLRGNALQLANNHEQALLCYDQALRWVPDFAAAINNKAHSLRMQNRPDEALAVLERLLGRQPSYALALNNKGLALLDLQRVSDALHSFDAALAVNPTLLEALGNRGTSLLRLKRFTEAAATLERLEALAPGFDCAIGNLVSARRGCCEWDGLKLLVDRTMEALQRGCLADLPLSFLYTSDSPAAQLKCAATFSAALYPAPSNPTSGGWPHRHERTCVAYLSGDFGGHAVAHSLVAVIERHDRKRLRVIGIGWGRQNDGQVRRRLEAAFETFVDATRLSDGEIVTLLRELEVDIAVDLMGHTQGQRTAVFAQRSAPVQVAYLGYPGTSGTPYIDYLIGDPVVIPDGEDAYYSEQLVRLPYCYFPTDDRRPIADGPATRAAAGLPSAGFVFCAFNNPAKFTPEMFEIWLRLLRQVPDSVLWLRAGTAEACTNLERVARESGVRSGALIFAETLDSIDVHLARQRLADLFLDTLPYNAHTTACDALWAGLPIVTCRGRSFAGRVGASLLETLGLHELVAETIAEYESKALDLALNPTKLAAVRTKLWERRKISPLFNTNLYTRYLETAYERMRTQHSCGRDPQSFSVAALPLSSL